MNPNSLFYQGVRYLLSHSDKIDDEILSKIPVIDTINCDSHLNWKDKQKQTQVSNLSSLVKGYNAVVEIGSGSGLLAKEMAVTSKVTAVDTKEHLFRKDSYKGNNITTVSSDALDYDVKGDCYIGLHACGKLTDRIIDLGIKYSSDVIVVPCCYALLSNDFPRSETFKGNPDFLNILKEIGSDESRNYSDSKKDSYNASLDLRRLIINLDRSALLQEHNFDVSFFYITPRKKVQGNESYTFSPHRLGIIGKSI